MKKLWILSALLFAAVAAEAQPVPSVYVPLAPCRVFDSRTVGTGLPLAADTTTFLVVRGLCNVPVTANSVTAIVTMFGATSPGFLFIWESDLPVPAAGNSAFRGAGSDSTEVVVRLSYPAGEDPNDIALRPRYAATHVVIDVVGYTIPL